MRQAFTVIEGYDRLRNAEIAKGVAERMGATYIEGVRGEPVARLDTALEEIERLSRKVSQALAKGPVALDGYAYSAFACYEDRLRVAHGDFDSDPKFWRRIEIPDTMILVTAARETVERRLRERGERLDGENDWGHVLRKSESAWIYAYENGTLPHYIDTTRAKLEESVDEAVRLIRGHGPK